MRKEEAPEEQEKRSLEHEKRIPVRNASDEIELTGGCISFHISTKNKEHPMCTCPIIIENQDCYHSGEVVFGRMQEFPNYRSKRQAHRQHLIPRLHQILLPHPQRFPCPRAFFAVKLSAP